MNFNGWLKRKKLSESSIKKYESALSGIMSDWAVEAGLVHEPLTAIKDLSHFQKISSALKNVNIYKERNERGHNMYSSALKKYTEYLAEIQSPELEEDIEKIIKQKNLSNTEKNSLIKIRIGQGDFRRDLVNYWKGCAVSGYKNETLLVASHIKPWRVSSNFERLDFFNGLLLLPNFDRAFDSGFITFEKSGLIRLSPLLEFPQLLGIAADMRINLDSKHQSYMQYHREKVFRES